MFKNCLCWIGVVENTVDPYKRGRIQVRVFGAHDTYNVPETDASGRTSWNNVYNGSASTSSTSGNMPVISSNGSKLAIWQRYNNPMNLKRVGGAWRRFDDISLAFPAYKAQLKRYYDGKTTGTRLTTPAAMISVWAPPNENKTQEYINNVAKWTGLDMYSPIDMNNDTQVAKMLRGMTRMESSLDFSEADIVAALNGQIVPSMTNVSTLYKDGNLYTGTSNAAQGVASTPGDMMPNTSSGQAPGTETPSTTPGKDGMGAQEKKEDATQVPQYSGALEASSAYEPDITGHTLKTEDLPWAVCLYSAVEYGGTTYSTLPAPQVQKGAWVFGIALDGDFMNQLFVLGLLPNLQNIDALSTNPNEANAEALTSSLSSLGSQQMPAGSEPDKELNGAITFAQFLDGVWYAESSKGLNKQVSSAFCYGTMQLMPAGAAGYLLNGVATEAFEKAGWKMSEETIEMLKFIRNTKVKTNSGYTTGFWGSTILTAQEQNPLVKDFCDLLQNNDSLNKAIGAAYLRDCITSSQGNNDPVLGALYYMQGVPNTRKILQAMGVSNNKIPDDMSYSDFIDKANYYIRNVAKQNNDFKIYTDNIFQNVGGIANLEKNRRVEIK